MADDGLYWPDEIFQSLEPAHRWVFGYGLVAWEFIDGARNWTFPALVGAVMRLAVTFGATSPGAYLTAVKLAFCAVSLGTGWGAFRLAKALGAPAVPATLAAVIVLLGAPFIYFSPRAMSETASALPVVLGLAFAVDPTSNRKWQLIGAALLGLAVLLRLQNAVFCAGLLAYLCAFRRWRQALDAFAVLAGFALFYGLLDKLTWGSFFHSARKYLEFNLVQDGAARWGTAAPTYYARILFRSMPALTLLTGALVLVAARRTLGVFLIAAAFLALHSWTPHKELRFVLPVLPVLAAIASVGLGMLPELAQKGAMALVLGAALFSAGRFHELTFGDLGQYEDQRPTASAYDDAGPINRLLLKANAQADLCGLKIEAIHLAWTGGYAYLHRNVPLYPNFGPPRESGLYNYAITFPSGAGEVVAVDGGVALVRLHRNSCAPDPAFSWRLP